jgi:hypothetical protein
MVIIIRWWFKAIGANHPRKTVVENVTRKLGGAAYKQM